MFSCWLCTSSPPIPKLLWQHNMSNVSHCINPKVNLTKRGLFNRPHALLSLSKTYQIDSYELKWLGDMNLELVDFEPFATGFLWLPCLFSLQSQDQFLDIESPWFMHMFCSTIQAIVTVRTFFWPHSFLRNRTRHRPLSWPYAPSLTILALLRR